MIYNTVAYPRAGLIGNPSDGYFGKTISFCFTNFQASVMLWESPELIIQPMACDLSEYASLQALAEDVQSFGYYGGIRLLKAAIKRFYKYCIENNITLQKKQFTIRYETNIPHHVGLAGSSAIITASMRALLEFYNVTIDKPILANLILSVENEELGIPAGLQDRVAQVYGGVTYMDFNKDMMLARGYGEYKEIDPKLLPNLYIAYRTDLSEGSEVFHSDIRHRYNKGDSEVIDAMLFWANLTSQAYELLKSGNGKKIGPLLDSNFDKRASLYKISEGNLWMVKTARKCGASAKFSGSGGAIVGVYEDDAMFDKLSAALTEKNVVVIKPNIHGQ